MAPRRYRLLLVAVALSASLHIAAALLVVLLPRFLPADASPEDQGTVELLMVETKGAEPGAAPTPNEEPKPEQPQAKPVPADPAPQSKTDAPEQQQRADDIPPPAANTAPPPVQGGDEPSAPPPEPAPPNASAADVQPAAQPDEQQPAPFHSLQALEPTPPQPQQAPVIDLSGTDSKSNAFVLGGRVLPAMPDDRFRNRPPRYPIEAEMRGEYGSVVLVIHVSEKGVATGADVQESSGHDLLDQAAVTAVRKWHFHPAMKEGRAIPFDMPFRFIFQQY